MLKTYEKIHYYIQNFLHKSFMYLSDKQVRFFSFKYTKIERQYLAVQK